jgi:hypothetical protein
MRWIFVKQVSVAIIHGIIIWAGVIAASKAQTPAEVRQAFIDLRDDKVPHNCEDATDWLFKNRDQLKEDLVDELPKTDWQGRDSILDILCRTESFTPDARFIRVLMSTLRDNQVGGDRERAEKWLSERSEQLKENLVEELYKTDWQGRNSILGILNQTKSFVPDELFIGFVLDTLNHKNRNAEFLYQEVMDADCRFISDHFAAFEPRLKDQLSHTTSAPNDMLKLWIIVWLAKKQGVFEQYAPLITPPLYSAAATNLKDDKVSHNASEAVRFFLLMGDASLPVLEQVTKSSDRQAANLAKATIGALRGERSAFGFLVTRVDISASAFGPEVDTPAWVQTAMEPYFRRETYP